MPEQMIASVAVDMATEKRLQVAGWFYVGGAVFMILLSAAGFGPSFIDQATRIAAPTMLVLAHGVVASTWLLLFLAQAILVAT